MALDCWRDGCTYRCSRQFRGKGSGYNLTTLFGNVEVTTIASPEAPGQKKKHGLLPVLVVLFCLSYGLMTMLIVEQGRTIDSQRALIRELFRDSVALNSARMKALHEKGAATAKGQSQTPSTQDQNQTPSSQAAPQRRTPNQNVQPRQYQSSRPASDQAQDREALIRI